MTIGLKLKRLAAAVAVPMIAASYAPAAHAEDSVSPNGKGIAGGALLGAEVVTITESIAGVHAGWAYIVGGIAGAGAGGVGGYFVEHSSTDAHAPVYMLVGGLALVIPAVVLSLNATRYQPEGGFSEDNAPTGPTADPGEAPPASTPPASGTAPPPPPPAAKPQARNTVAPVLPLSLVDVREGGFRMGLPIPDVRPMWTAAQLSQYGMQQGTEVRVPVVNMTF